MSQKQHWTSLDGLRAIAVCLVMVVHGQVAFIPNAAGGIGVDIFFVLSGFLITGILSREFSSHGSINLRNFYARRFLRLAPCLMVTCAVFGLVSLAIHGTANLQVIVIAMTYVVNWARAFHLDMEWLAHCWSLSCEEQFYLVWPVVVLGIERMSTRSTTKGLFLIAIAVLLALYRSMMVGVYDPDRIYNGLDTHMDALVFGAALSYLVKNARSFSDTFMKRWSFFAVPIGIFGLIALSFTFYVRSRGMGLLGFFYSAVAGMVIVADLVASPYSLLRGMLSNRALVYVGKISYGLYLMHYPIFHFAKVLFPAANSILLAIGGIAVSFIVAAISFHFIEAPILKLKKRFETQPIAKRSAMNEEPVIIASA